MATVRWITIRSPRRPEVFMESRIILFWSQFPFEGAVKDGGEEGVEFGGGLGLQAVQRIHCQAKVLIEADHQVPSFNSVAKSSACVNMANSPLTARGHADSGRSW